MSYFYSLRTGMRIILITLVGYLFFLKHDNTKNILIHIYFTRYFLIHYKNGK